MKKIAVIGAGIMGTGIAACFANAEIEVYLFDLEKEGVLIAKDAKDKLTDIGNSQLVHHSVLEYIKPVSLTQDMAKLSECNLIIEAIIEKIEVKQELFKKLAKFIKDDAIIASNTSTFSLKELTSNLSETLAKKIVICHFFNPPRHLRLLEFIPGAISDAQKNNLSKFLTKAIGREVVVCHDSPGFIANRLGCYLMELTLLEAERNNLSITDIDQAFNKFIGFPSTGIFGLYDLIGLDVMVLISKSLRSSLNKEDDFNKVSVSQALLNKLINDGYTGRKGKGGFYKLEYKGRDKKKYALNLKSFEYEHIYESKTEAQNTKEFFESRTNIAQFLQEILGRFFAYVLSVQTEICVDFHDIDRAMKLGFGWKIGPYEMMKLYSNLVPSNLQSKMPAQIDKYRLSTKTNSLAKIIHDKNLQPVYESGASRLWQLEKNKLCLEITTKLHVLTNQVFEDILKIVKIAEKSSADLIIYSDEDYFSAGADLKLLLGLAKNNDYNAVNEYLALGQRANLALKYTGVPVISCAKGIALGGGCELLLHSDYILADQELKAGLVEASLNLVPSFGGLKEMIMLPGDQSVLNKRFRNIMRAFKSSSALDFAINMNLGNVKIFANKNEILEYALKNKFAKKTAKILKTRIDLNDVNMSDFSNEQKEIASTIIKSLATRVPGEELILTIERKIFCDLLSTSLTISKIESALG
ncbi:MAG: 3-hydroxyacyl-CoA dehydrogenase NAD-binding domain-containing protein [Rickettsiaceae bacterium]|nr:3-hydroxyacyl-CoA dehydrogenase NAD-binding domain-containing protein [Rickettsiaceae bacterium]